MSSRRPLRPSGTKLRMSVESLSSALQFVESQDWTHRAAFGGPEPALLTPEVASVNGANKPACRWAIWNQQPEPGPVGKVGELGPFPLPSGFLLSRTRPVLPSCNTEVPIRLSWHT
jgi:hypothetical protein